MKPTADIFKKTIKEYLDKRAADDPLFAVSYAKEKKTIDGCINYIFYAVKESGRQGFTDDEVYSMAVHYYDEDKLKYSEIKRCDVVVNHNIELTPEEKKEARKNAIQNYQDSIMDKMKSRKKKPKTKTDLETQPTLF